NTNAKYGKGITLGTDTFTTPGTFTVADNIVPALTFSLTERYHIVAKGAGSELSTITTSTNAGVPEPATWALMIAGFGGIGAAHPPSGPRACLKTVRSSLRHAVASGRRRSFLVFARRDKRWRPSDS